VISSVAFNFDTSDDASTKLKISVAMRENIGVESLLKTLALEPILQYICDYTCDDYMRLTKADHASYVIGCKYYTLIPALFDGYESEPIAAAEIYSQVKKLESSTLSHIQFSGSTHAEVLSKFKDSNVGEARLHCTSTNATFAVQTINNVLYFRKLSTKDGELLLRVLCETLKALRVQHDTLIAIKCNNDETDAAYDKVTALLGNIYSSDTTPRKQLVTTTLHTAIQIAMSTTRTTGLRTLLKM
jgi:hypothetical protein